MFTVLSKPRTSNLYLIAALVIVVAALLAFVAFPAVSDPERISVPVSRPSDTESDYFLRHPELRVSAASAADVTGDFYLRHPEWISNVQSPAIPVTGAAGASDYFQRHPELRAPAETTDLSDYFLRH